MNFRFYPPSQNCVKNGESEAVKAVKPVKELNFSLVHGGEYRVIQNQINYSLRIVNVS